MVCIYSTAAASAACSSVNLCCVTYSNDHYDLKSQRKLVQNRQLDTLVWRVIRMLQVSHQKETHVNRRNGLRVRISRCLSLNEGIFSQASQHKR
ncbi:hypothetical protein M8C21_006619, partial [Ambrosia artemisiifolia]